MAVEDFNFLGAGNGFPECAEKIDVSGYDYWITLGGNKKGDPTPQEESKKESFEMARAIFWRFNKTVFIGNMPIELATIHEAPYARRCADSNQISFAFPGVYPISPIRMFNGDVDEESNFVGFGINSGGGGANWTAKDRGGIVSLFLSSYMNAFSFEGEHDTNYTAVPDMGGNLPDAHLVCFASGGTNEDTPNNTVTYTANAVNRIATFSSTVSGTAYVEIQGLEFLEWGS